MVMSDFRPEVEIRPFCACAMKNMQYNPYLWLIRQNFRVFQEIGIEEHDGDVRFKSVACAIIIIMKSYTKYTNEKYVKNKKENIIIIIIIIQS